MTAKSSRRVVIINNIKSDKIEQAIFILKGNNLQKPDKGIIKEAQDIIDDYIKRVGGKELIPPNDFHMCPPKRRKFGAGLLSIMLCSLLLCLILIVKSLAG